ncbi:MAG: DUF3418 domain-containing protein, partial [Phycisphaerales bacterium]|nr:DUF3418 domain-containing protein [Phycisphaerales bacterium]
VRFTIHPGSGLAKKFAPPTTAPTPDAKGTPTPPKAATKGGWVMAAELVTTTKVYARTVARIEPEWIERVGPHLLKRSHFDPHWDDRSQSVLAYEKVLLFGLEVVAKRRVQFGPIDPRLARELFIRHALVQAELRTAAPFLEHNLKLEEKVRSLEARLRRSDVLVAPEMREAFYDQRLGEGGGGISSNHDFERWRKDAERAKPQLLLMKLPDLLAVQLPGNIEDLYPDTLIAGSSTLPLEYIAEPGHPDDGVSVIVPLEAAGQLIQARADWLVPGLLQEKTVELIRSLPKPVRVNLVPAPQTAAKALPLLLGKFPRAASSTVPSFFESLAAALTSVSGTLVEPSMFVADDLPQHLKLNIKVIDEQGRLVARGRDVAEVHRAVSSKIAEALAKLPEPRFNRAGIRTWDFGDLPERLELSRAGLRIEAFPALVEESGSGGSVAPAASLRLFRSLEVARHAMRSGVRRLLALALEKELKYQLAHLPGFDAMALKYAAIAPGGKSKLRDQLAAAVAERACLADRAAHTVRTEADFRVCVNAGWHKVAKMSHEVGEETRQVLMAHGAVASALHSSFMNAPLLIETAEDIKEQLAFLVSPDFLLSTPREWFPHLPRFLGGIQRRIQRLSAGGAQGGALDRDRAAMAELAGMWRAYRVRAEQRAGQGLPPDPALEQIRWMLEELRISLFAQELKTSVPVSAQRLQKLWAAVA